MLDTGTTTSGSHLLQIDGYSIAKHAPNGTSLKSCPFMVGGYRWMIHLFPNGDGPESSGFISVFISLYKYFKRGRVSLQVELSFVDEVEKQNPAHVRTRQVLELRTIRQLRRGLPQIHREGGLGELEASQR
ncbi:hypothetical protein QYE76_057855 [Lolium multiflorum]|uniref:MATH domain-containing protein n=1 Tax=Lolium multiflorum TaxID=4521 RepID=A0AAD8T5P0_LOLMU|nr:hypothetical protein QYE76_057855 [Lolium multiflorum]